MNTFIGILIFVYLFHFTFGAAYTKRSIQEKQEKYEKYVECLKKRSETIQKWGIQRSYKAVIFQRFANIKLECFQCLSPDDEDNVEDIWKPNDSFIARTIQFITDKFKKFVSKYAGGDQISIKFVWEYLEMDSLSDWELVIPEYGKSTASPSEKAKRVVQSFLNRGKSTKEEIGNHFEIEIFNSQHFKHSGFYRCLRITSKNKIEYVEKKIEQLYFVDIFTSVYVTVREVASVDDDENEVKNLPKLPHLSSNLIEAKWIIQKWGECNRCGKNVLGEQRRKIECVIEPKNGTTVTQLANSDVSFLTMFENVPCLSSLLSLKYRQKLQTIKNIEEFRSCQSLCLLPNDETRKVKDVDDSGKEFVADELPPNEFSVFERLPPLRSSVIRKTVRGNEGDHLVLDCGQNNGDIFWRRDFKDLHSKDLLSEDSKKYINSDGQLIFQVLDTSDAGFYSCFTTPNVLQRTFRVYINKINKTEEIIMYVKIIIRYFTGFLIAILILRTILKTNANAEYRHRSAGVKRD
uniref:Ig-like domain-containing protein n=1 Tax=Panagrolaimus sp. ES5 TaxID=591445 RepID=A0AC34FRJ4_9BILA